MKVKFPDSANPVECNQVKVNWPNHGEVAIYKSNGNHWVHEYFGTQDGIVFVGKFKRMHYVS